MGEAKARKVFSLTSTGPGMCNLTCAIAPTIKARQDSLARNKVQAATEGKTSNPRTPNFRQTAKIQALIKLLPKATKAKGRARSPLRADETIQNGEIPVRLHPSGAQGTARPTYPVFDNSLFSSGVTHNVG